MINWLIESINIVCLIFTITGSILVNRQGERLRSWLVYLVAASTGVLYFILTGNIFQLVIWIFFLVNDIDAIRVRVKKNGDE
jgi:hypothetical protein